jgi:hypothetical protein
MNAKQILFLSLVIITIGAILWRIGRRIISRGKLSEATIVKNIYYPNELTRIQIDHGIEDDESVYFQSLRPLRDFEIIEDENTYSV